MQTGATRKEPRRLSTWAEVQTRPGASPCKKTESTCRIEDQRLPNAATRWTSTWKYRSHSSIGALPREYAAARRRKRSTTQQSRNSIGLGQDTRGKTDRRSGNFWSVGAMRRVATRRGVAMKKSDKSVSTNLHRTCATNHNHCHSQSQVRP